MRFDSEYNFSLSDTCDLLHHDDLTSQPNKPSTIRSGRAQNNKSRGIEQYLSLERVGR
jgi:hypothetical protein